MPDGGKAVEGGRKGGRECVKRGEGRGGRGIQCHAARDAPLGSDLGSDTWRIEVDELTTSGIENRDSQIL